MRNSKTIRVLFFVFCMLTLLEARAQNNPIYRTHNTFNYGFANYNHTLNENAVKSKQSMSDNIYINLDWQINGPINNQISGNASGWGASLQGGYFLTSKVAVGGFFSFHTNNEYVPRRTFYWEGTALSVDQQHSLFQIPFGLSFRYRFTDDGIFKPYCATNLGVQYARSESYMNNVNYYHDAWGFYVSPELGIEIKPFKHSRVGFHVAAYYSYATNDNSLLWYDSEGLNNYGIRLGFAF